MSHFKKRFSTDFGKAEFFFNRLFTVRGIRYHISVCDDKRISCFFNMERKDGEWYIIEATEVPGWIMLLERELSKAIIDYHPLELD
jgi:hypothetical protein